MKHKIFAAIITAFSFLLTVTAHAQTDEPQQEIPKWVSSKGYWVVQSNKKTPKEAVVYFYNNDNLLVYKEEIRNQKLKINRKKTLLRLKAALEEAIIAHAQGTWARQDNLLAYHLQQ